MVSLFIVCYITIHEFLSSTDTYGPTSWRYFILALGWLHKVVHFPRLLMKSPLLISWDRSDLYLIFENICTVMVRDIYILSPLDDNVTIKLRLKYVCLIIVSFIMFYRASNVKVTVVNRCSNPINWIRKHMKVSNKPKGIAKVQQDASYTSFCKLFNNVKWIKQMDLIILLICLFSIYQGKKQ